MQGSNHHLPAGYNIRGSNTTRLGSNPLLPTGWNTKGYSIRLGSNLLFPAGYNTKGYKATRAPIISFLQAGVPTRGFHMVLLLVLSCLSC